MNVRSFFLAALCSCLWTAPAAAGQVRVAVASGVAAPLRQIAASFERDTGNKVVSTVAPTSGLYRDILQGAEFDVLVSGNGEVLARLEAARHVVSGTRYVYAVSPLVLWSPHEGYVDSKGAVLIRNEFQRLSVASPSLVYGRPAAQVLDKLGISEAVAQKLVERRTIDQSQQFIASGTAELGFVTLSQITVNGRLARGSAWLVPRTLYDPVEQEAAVLEPGRDNLAARSFLFYLKGPRAGAILLQHGFFR